ncbi:MAG: aminopeptidase P N-terminal domain-containing protein [Fidelibacterota bacterium]
MKKITLILINVLIFIPFISSANSQDLEEFSQRRERFRTAMAKNSVAIFKSAKKVNRNGDVNYEFRQGSNFYYLTGLDEPESALIISKERRFLRTKNGFFAGNEFLYVRPRNPAMEQWTGKRLGIEGAKKEMGIELVFDITDFKKHLPGYLRGVDTLYIKIPGVGLDQPLNEELTLIKNLKERLFSFEILDPGTILSKIRIIKSDSELKLIQKAIDITGEALIEAMKSAKPGMYEYELEAIIEFIFRWNGSERLGFPSIIGSGPNSVILHYTKNDRKIESGDLVVLDVGAEYGYYTADVTRTIPISGKFTEPQKEIYSIVLKAQRMAIEAVKPGITLNDLNQIARDYLNSKGYGKYFIHGLSHFVGLDVHDAGNRSVTLEPGMVFTIEPGIYINPDESDVDPEYRGIGVRIEDDILLTEKGAVILSKKIPRTIEAVEKIMAKKGRF